MAESSSLRAPVGSEDLVNRDWVTLAPVRSLGYPQEQLGATEDYAERKMNRHQQCWPVRKVDYNIRHRDKVNLSFSRQQS